MVNDYLNLMAQLQASIDEVRSMMPVGDDQTTSVEYSPGGAIITAIDNSPPESEGGGGDTYEGQFKVTDGAEEDTVDIAAGKVINGTVVTNVPQEAAVGTIGSLYVSLEIWYGSGWEVGYEVGTSYPTQEKKDDKWTLRVLIASRADTDSDWVQQHFGEVHNTRITA